MLYALDALKLIVNKTEEIIENRNKWNILFGIDAYDNRFKLFFNVIERHTLLFLIIYNCQ